MNRLIKKLINIIQRADLSDVEICWGPISIMTRHRFKTEISRLLYRNANIYLVYWYAELDEYFKMPWEEDVYERIYVQGLNEKEFAFLQEEKKNRKYFQPDIVKIDLN